MGKYPDFTVIIPTYNEASNAPFLVQRIFRALPGASVLVADDCSTDGTAKALSRFSRNGRFRLLERRGARVRGISASVLDGISLAKTKYVIVMDGDFQHPPEKLPAIARGLLAGNDIAVASRRRVAGDWPLPRQAMSRGAHVLGCLSLGLSGRQFGFDIMSGYFGMRRDLALRAKKERIVLSGYKIFFDIFKQLPRGVMVFSVPYDFGTRKKGRSKIGARHILGYAKSLVS